MELCYISRQSNSKRIIFFFLLVCPIMVHGQYELRPIIDSTVACSYYNGLGVERYFDPEAPKKYAEKVHMEIFYIVEQMPIPEIDINEVEKALKDEVRLNEHEKTLHGNMYFQCIVNCKGKAGDFQIIHCPDEFMNIGCQALYVLREKIFNWEPGRQRGKSVDVLITIMTTINKGSFEVTAPLY